MTEEQKAYLECFKIAAEYCGQTNRAIGRVHYAKNDLYDIARHIAASIDIKE